MTRNAGSPHGVSQPAFLSRLPPALPDLTLLLVAALWLWRAVSTVARPHLVDFVAFHGAGGRVLAHLSPYGCYPTAYGASCFQSPPWLAWLFAPLALLPLDRAWPLYVALNCALLLACVHLLLRSLGARLSPVAFLYTCGCALGVAFFALDFGQVVILQLAAIALMLLALQARRPALAGLLTPLVLIKPHLVIFFLFCACLRGGRKMVAASAASTAALVGLSFILQPDWLFDLVDVLVAGQRASQMDIFRFNTLAGLLWLPPWVGFAITLVALPPLVWLEKRFRRLPVTAWLSIALALSLATSPYSLAYDFALLIPALVWLSLPWSPRSLLLWGALALLPVIADFTGVCYVGTLFVCAYSLTLNTLPAPRPHTSGKYIS